MKHSQTDSGGSVVGISAFGLILDGRVCAVAKGDDAARGDEPAVILRGVVRWGVGPKGDGVRLEPEESGRWLGWTAIGDVVLDWRDIDEADPTEAEDGVLRRC